MWISKGGVCPINLNDKASEGLLYKTKHVMCLQWCIKICFLKKLLYAFETKSSKAYNKLLMMSAVGWIQRQWNPVIYGYSIFWIYTALCYFSYIGFDYWWLSRQYVDILDNRMFNELYNYWGAHQRIVYLLYSSYYVHCSLTVNCDIQTDNQKIYGHWKKVFQVNDLHLVTDETVLFLFWYWESLLCCFEI